MSKKAKNRRDQGDAPVGGRTPGETAAAAAPDPPTPAQRWKETAKLVLGAVVLSLVLRASVVEAYIVPSGSMEDTILPGDTLIGNKFLFGARIPLIGVRLPALRDPRPGDVIIFRHPIEEGERLVKRVVAVEGQTVEIRAKHVWVDGREVPLPETAKFSDGRVLPQGVSNRDNLGPVKVPPGKLFVMGDNRDDSFDSRGWGFLDSDMILGKAMFVLYSWEQDRTEPFWARIRWGRIGQGLH